MNPKHTPHPSSVDDSELDRLLMDSSFVQVPADFEQKVLQAIDVLPERKNASVRWWQWLALAGSAVPGIMELSAFVFSLWTVSSVG
ncbi:MAG: hypothetical protein R3F02_01325 [Thiolinea sp.]